MSFMQQKLRVLHKTFFTVQLTRSFTNKWKKKTVFSFYVISFPMHFFNVSWHFKAVVKKKEEQQTFPVDIEVK